jgi:hypothetical protein
MLASKLPEDFGRSKKILGRVCRGYLLSVWREIGSLGGVDGTKAEWGIRRIYPSF